MNSKIITGLALVIGLLIAIVMAVQVGQSDFKTVYITTIFIFSVPICLLLGMRSWYILPFAMTAGLPAIPLTATKSLSLAEFGIPLFCGLLLLAVIQGRQRFQMKIGDWWPLLLCGSWVMMIALLNGVGLDILGSEKMGGRAYLTIGIYIPAMLALSQISIRDKEARRVCWLLLVTKTLSGIYMMINFFLSQEEQGFYGWQQGFSGMAMGGVMLLFARNTPIKVIKSPLYSCLYLVLLVMVLYSGKRMGLVICCVIPMIAAFWHRQAMVSLFASVAAFLLIITAVTVQNEVTSLPKTVQRALSFLPGDWDWEVKQTSEKAIFRNTLNRWAMLEVEENPIIGRGLTLSREDLRLMEDKAYVYQIMFPEDDPQAFSFIASKMWHSTWLGLAATFGIPMTIFWLCVQISVLKRSWKLGHTGSVSSWQGTLLAMIFFMMCSGVITSFTSGNAASLFKGAALQLGILAAIKNGKRDDSLEQMIKLEVANDRLTGK